MKWSESLQGVMRNEVKQVFSSAIKEILISYFLG